MNHLLHDLQIYVTKHAIVSTNRYLKFPVDFLFSLLWFSQIYVYWVVVSC